MDRTARLIPQGTALGSLLLLLLGACAGTPPTADSSAVRAGTRTAPARPEATHGASRQRTTITRIATDMLGVRYRYGGTSPDEGFDCSGLVYYAYAKAGLSVPRNSVQLFNASSKIALERAAAGDLVFFQDQSKLSHVGIYLGDNRFVHAPSSGSTVRISSLDSPYFQRHLVGVGRLIAAN